jgi:putative drug exporter of the RND superfamily
LHSLQFCAECAIVVGMRRLAAFAYDRRRLVVAAWIAAIAAAFALAAGAGGGFVNNFTLPGTESQRALDLLEERFPQQSGDSSQIVFAVRDGRLTDAQRRTQVAGVVQRVERLPHVTAVQSP